MFKHLLSFLLTVSLTLFAATAVGQGTACVDMQVVDDFEGYNDDCELIFYAWTDGSATTDPANAAWTPMPATTPVRS
ncbi:MAG: hypothetical protein IH892_13350 [Planctomycetes bacterium]|nr:hypothetical protein [Planctomycetota bacterium]